MPMCASDGAESGVVYYLRSPGILGPMKYLAGQICKKLQCNEPLVKLQLSLLRNAFD